MDLSDQPPPPRTRTRTRTKNSTTINIMFVSFPPYGVDLGPLERQDLHEQDRPSGLVARVMEP